MTTATATTDVFHPVSAIFPLLDGEEFETLVDSVRDKGLINSIWRDNDGLIIDGRNRYRACLEAGVAPHYKQWDGEGSLTDFVVAQNIERRHLNATQKALLAKKLEPLYSAEAKERQQEGGRSKVPQNVGEAYSAHNGEAAARAAKRTGSNRQYVADLKKMEQESPEVYARVESGELELAAAKKEMRIADELKYPCVHPPVLTVSTALLDRATRIVRRGFTGEAIANGKTGGGTKGLSEIRNATVWLEGVIRRVRKEQMIGTTETK